ncbi:MAG: hypothetical protein E7406_03670 [Ruminococcaceae bacterium]|nr:hypothetical protein [Oscillospiraceae bacterium]
MSNIIEELFYGNLEPQYIAKRISEECNISNKPVTIDDIHLMMLKQPLTVKNQLWSNVLTPRTLFHQKQKIQNYCQSAKISDFLFGYSIQMFFK